MLNDAFLKRIILIGIFLIPLIPLLVTESLFFPYITGKNFAFRIVIDIIFSAWLILAIRNPDYRPKVSGIFSLFAIFISVLALADAFGANPVRSFWSNFERMEGLVTFLHLFAYFIVLTTVLKTQELWGKLLKTSIGVSIVVGIVSIAELWPVWFEGATFPRIDSTFGNATYLAAYSFFHIFFVFFLYVKEKWSGREYALYAGVLFFNLLSLYYTATRGALLGLLLGGFLTLLILALFGKEYPKLRRVALGSIIFVVVFVSGFIALRDTSFVRESPVLGRYANISIKDATTNSRLLLWEMTLEGVKERPLLGWGQDNFNIVFNKYYDPGMYRYEPFFDRAHNVFFDWLIAGGILGLIAYLGMYLFTLFLLWWKKKDAFSLPEKAIITGLLGAYFIHNFFVFDNLTSYLLFFGLLAYLHTKFTEDTPQESTRQFSLQTQYIVSALALILVLFSVYFFSIRGIFAAQHLIQGIIPQQAGIQANLDRFEKAIDFGPLGTIEAREQLVQFAQRVINASQIPTNVKDTVYTFAAGHMLDQIKKTPHDARLEIFIAGLYTSARRYDDAIVHWNRALSLSPQKQSILYELGSAHITKGEVDTGLAYLRQAYESFPENTDAQTIYGIGAVYANRLELAEFLLTPTLGGRFADDDRLIRAYAAIKDYDALITLWEARLLKQKELGKIEAQPYVSLAAIYLEIEARTKAINILREGISDNKTLEPLLSPYIETIQAGKNPGQ